MADTPRISRRRFLRRTILGGAALAVGGVVAKHASGYHLDEETRGKLKVLSAKEYLIVAAVCRRVLAPDELGAPSPDEVEAPLVIDDYLAHLDGDLVSDLKALLHVFEHGAAISAWPPSRFTRLDAGAQDRVLAAWQESRLDFRRQGFQALKTLAVLGYYDDRRTYPILGYGGPLLEQR